MYSKVGQTRREIAPELGRSNRYGAGTAVRHVSSPHFSLMNAKLSPARAYTPLSSSGQKHITQRLQGTIVATQQRASIGSELGARAQTISRINPSPTTIPKTALGTAKTSRANLSACAALSCSTTQYRGNAP